MNVEIPETLNAVPTILEEIKVVTEPIPETDRALPTMFEPVAVVNLRVVIVPIPALICCTVKFVAPATPKVLTPTELIFVIVALVLFRLVIVPTPEKLRFVPLICLIVDASET